MLLQKKQIWSFQAQADDRRQRLCLEESDSSSLKFSLVTSIKRREFGFRGRKTATLTRTASQLIADRLSKLVDRRRRASTVHEGFGCMQFL